MALDRTNMVSLFDTGTWLGGSTPALTEMGDGFTEISEDWGPEFVDTKYVNMKNSSSTLNGYALSMTPEREHLSDTMQTKMNEAFRTFPTGAKAESFYYRYYKTDITVTEGVGSGPAIKVPVTAGPSSTGGASSDPLKSSIEIHGNGDVIPGTISIAKNGTHTFTPTT